MRKFCFIERPMTVDAAAALRRGVEHLLHARDVAREGGHDHPAVEALHDLVERLADGLLGRRVAGVLGARRVGHEAEHAGEPRGEREVGQPAVDRGVVELEVPGVDDRAERRSRAMPMASGIECPTRNGLT